MQCHSQEEQPIPEDLKSLLVEFEDVFALPKELPPQRIFDHKIPLQSSNVNINVRPYRHPPAQRIQLRL